MLAHVLLTALTAGVAYGNPLFERAPTCTHDNCYRGILQTSTVYKPSLSVRLADCSSFMTATVTPATTTITVTGATVTNTFTSTSAVTPATITSSPNVAPRGAGAVIGFGTMPSYATWCLNTVAYSSGCSCAGIPTGTITLPTPSTTVTVTASASATTTVLSCANAGLQWAYFGGVPGNTDWPAYSAWDPTIFKTATPLGEGVTTYVGGSAFRTPQGGYANFYGETIQMENLAWAHRGYIYATQTGTYTFTITGSDDIVDIWLGSTAYSGWTRDNHFLEDTYDLTNDGTTTQTTSLVAGQYYPLRILYGNAQGDAVFGVTITAPDSSVILSDSTGPSQSIVQFSCDGVSALPYYPYGQES